MTHPILSSKFYTGLYYLFWILIAFAHFMANYKVFGAPVNVAIIDSLVYNILFSLFGLALWYSVRYSQMELYDTSTLIFQHTAIVCITVLSWMSLGYYSIKLIPVYQTDFTLLFTNSNIFKIINGFLYYALITLIYYVIIYYNNFKEKLVRETTLTNTIQRVELDMLRSQINPHFLFNSLNSISALTIREPSKAREMVSQLSDFLRYSIKESGNKMTVFEKEIDVVSNYLSIEKVRFSERMKVVEDLDESCLGAQLPNMILQPVIENAVKYGVAQQTGKSKITIQAGYFHGFLKVQVENNFDPKAVLKKGTGIGLDNIRKRMQLTYGRNDLVQISDKDGIFTVILTFPQQNDN
jgi:sensor histidine kinase YesM